MSEGVFPVRYDTDQARQLQEAMALVEKVVVWGRENKHGYDAETGAIDLDYIEQLEKAIHLIRGCVRPPNAEEFERLSELLAEAYRELDNLDTMAQARDRLQRRLETIALTKCREASIDDDVWTRMPGGGT